MSEWGQPKFGRDETEEKLIELGLLTRCPDCGKATISCTCEEKGE